MKKRVIKLINNERKNSKLTSGKACDSTSVDVCSMIDASECVLYAYDSCTKDYSPCGKGAHDICGYDITSCSGAGQIDRTY